MVAKITVFTILLTICKVQSQNQYPYGQASSVANCNNNAQNQGSFNTQPNQPQNVQPSNSNKGIKASPQLKIVPCQRYNLRAIPLSQYTGSSVPQSQPQNSGYDGFRENVQVPPVQSQVPSSASQGIQPSLRGPSPVIASPVSSINISPSPSSTVDYSLLKSLANALEMMIANELINSLINNNIVNQDFLQVPVKELVDFDLAGLLQSLNSRQCGQVANPIVTVPTQTSQITTPNQYQTPVPDYNTPVETKDWSQLLERLQDLLSKKPEPETDWDGVKNFLNMQNQQTIKPSQTQPATYPTQATNPNNHIIEAIAEYLGCDTSEVTKSSLPTVSEIYFPEEIPAQIICTYGHMPTTVPVISCNVQPVPQMDGSNSFIFGC